MEIVELCLNGFAAALLPLIFWRLRRVEAQVTNHIPTALRSIGLRLDRLEKFRWNG